MTVMRYPLRDDTLSLAGEPAAPAPALTPAPTALREILAQRPITHGDFTDNSRIAQNLKRIMAREEGWARLSDVQREALDLIVLKISRILGGNPHFLEHWLDLSGYATRAAERC